MIQVLLVPFLDGLVDLSVMKSCRMRKKQKILLLKNTILVTTLQFLFVCGISLTSGQLFNEQVVLRRRGGDRIYEMRCLFVAVGLNARFIVLPHWDNMSQAHMLTHPVTLY